MGYDLRLPNIKGATEKERLTQVESYLRQLVEQLQWAMNSLELVGTSGVNNAMQTTSKGSSQALEKAVDANATFNAIKHLIIKSADIVSAYYDEINKKLVGEYVAISDFGTFREETEQNIIANSQGIEQTFTNIQTIYKETATDIENVNTSLLESLDKLNEVVSGIDAYVLDVKAHIRSGQIDTIGGVPVFGIEVGQKILKDGVEYYDKFARFTSSKLSFYDHNDVEVAYVSDRQLYIGNVHILYSYKIGGIMDTVQPNGDVVTMWVGIGGDS